MMLRRVERPQDKLDAYQGCEPLMRRYRVGAEHQSSKNGGTSVAAKFDLTHIHHVNVLVRDIETAKQRYRDVFNVEFIDEPLPSRGVLTSRFSLGDSWLVLVQPVAEGEPMRQLRERGEGLFLLSLGVAQTERPVRDGVCSLDTSAEVREGISGWRVIDLKMDGMSTGQLQLALGQTD